MDRNWTINSSWPRHNFHKSLSSNSNPMVVQQQDIEARNNIEHSTEAFRFSQYFHDYFTNLKQYNKNITDFLNLDIFLSSELTRAQLIDDIDSGQLNILAYLPGSGDQKESVPISKMDKTIFQQLAIFVILIETEVYSHSIDKIIEYVEGFVCGSEENREFTQYDSIIGKILLKFLPKFYVHLIYLQGILFVWIFSSRGQNILPFSAKRLQKVDEVIKGSIKRASRLEKKELAMKYKNNYCVLILENCSIFLKLLLLPSTKKTCGSLTIFSMINELLAIFLEHTILLCIYEASQLKLLLVKMLRILLSFDADGYKLDYSTISPLIIKNLMNPISEEKMNSVLYKFPTLRSELPSSYKASKHESLMNQILIKLHLKSLTNGRLIKLKNSINASFLKNIHPETHEAMLKFFIETPSSNDRNETLIEFIQKFLLRFPSNVFQLLIFIIPDFDLKLISQALVNFEIMNNIFGCKDSNSRDYYSKIIEIFLVARPDSNYIAYFYPNLIHLFKILLDEIIIEQNAEGIIVSFLTKFINLALQFENKENFPTIMMLYDAFITKTLNLIFDRISTFGCHVTIKSCLKMMSILRPFVESHQDELPDALEILSVENFRKLANWLLANQTNDFKSQIDSLSIFNSSKLSVSEKFHCLLPSANICYSDWQKFLFVNSKIESTKILSQMTASHCLIYCYLHQYFSFELPDDHEKFELIKLIRIIPTYIKKSFQIQSDFCELNISATLLIFQSTFIRVHLACYSDQLTPSDYAEAIENVVECIRILSNSLKQLSFLQQTRNTKYEFCNKNDKEVVDTQFIFKLENILISFLKIEEILLARLDSFKGQQCFTKCILQISDLYLFDEQLSLGISHEGINFRSALCCRALADHIAYLTFNCNLQISPPIFERIFKTKEYFSSPNAMDQILAQDIHILLIGISAKNYCKSRQQSIIDLTRYFLNIQSQDDIAKTLVSLKAIKVTVKCIKYQNPCIFIDSLKFALHALAISEYNIQCSAFDLIKSILHSDYIMKLNLLSTFLTYFDFIYISSLVEGGDANVLMGLLSIFDCLKMPTGILSDELLFIIDKTAHLLEHFDEIVRNTAASFLYRCITDINSALFKDVSKILASTFENLLKISDKTSRFLLDGISKFLLNFDYRKILGFDQIIWILISNANTELTQKNHTSFLFLMSIIKAAGHRAQVSQLLNFKSIVELFNQLPFATFQLLCEAFACAGSASLLESDLLICFETKVNAIIKGCCTKNQADIGIIDFIIKYLIKNSCLSLNILLQIDSKLQTVVKKFKPYNYSKNDYIAVYTLLDTLSTIRLGYTEGSPKFSSFDGNLNELIYLMYTDLPNLDLKNAKILLNIINADLCTQNFLGTQSRKYIYRILVGIILNNNDTLVLDEIFQFIRRMCCLKRGSAIVSIYEALSEFLKILRNSYTNMSVEEIVDNPICDFYSSFDELQKTYDHELKKLCYFSTTLVFNTIDISRVFRAFPCKIPHYGSKKLTDYSLSGYYPLQQVPQIENNYKLIIMTKELKEF